MWAPTNEIRFKNMVLIDNTYGTGTIIGKEGNDLKIKMDSIQYFGETEHKDCEVEDECLTNPDTCVHKSAMMLPLFLVDYTLPFPVNTNPVDVINHDAAWGGKTDFKDITFTGFKSGKNFCGGRQRILESHKAAVDFIPEVIFDNAIFKDVVSDTLGYFNEPDPVLKRVERCGEIDCSGLKNVIVTFK